MDFDFTEDQVALRDAVARWVERSFTFERRHALAKAGGASRDVHRELAELGLTGLAVGPEHGGMGFGAIEAMVVMEELGRGLVHAPFAASSLVTPLWLAHAPADVQSAWLPRVADGSALVVPALQEQGARYRLDAVATTAAPQAGGWALSGHKHLVPAGDEADAYLVPARLGPHAVAPIGLFVVERARCQVRAYPTQDGARAADATFASSPATLITSDAADVLERANDVLIAAACAEGVGAMERLVAITVEYMNTRKQFGATLASFQALRHRIADVKMQLELARSMSYFASLKLGEPAPARRRALSQAKVQLGQSLRFVGQQCIQLHGGIGVTDECSASHYFKRLTMLEFVGGDMLHHLGEVSERMADTAGVFA
jgi:alkylation response protein AidB-like acyl-CoA dehydrogenase